MVRRALVSVFDKSGLTELATVLTKHDIELVSTGGTARALTEAGFKVVDVAEVTGMPEYPGGLVKTLHPKVHFGILADRDKPDHMERLKTDAIAPIDLVICNLYDFASVAYRENVTDLDLHQLIDIGGPTMIRAAAKNWAHVTVVCDPADYSLLAEELTAREGYTSEHFRKRMAVKAFGHTADYDALVNATLARQFATEPVLRLKFTDGKKLRYGENPHQSAMVFADRSYTGPNLTRAKQLWGKELSYNNLVDGDAAMEAVLDFPDCAVAVIKHTNPCGLATAADPVKALVKAWEGDPVSAFGSVIACNRPIGTDFLDYLEKRFVEMVIAPGFDESVIPWLESHNKKNLRLLAVGEMTRPDKRTVYRHLHGGMLMQDEDDQLFSEWKSVTTQPYPESRSRLAEFAFRVVKYVKSNEIVIAREFEPGHYQILSIGAGQPNRVDAIRKLALTKAVENLTLELKQSVPEPTGDQIAAYTLEVFKEVVLASGAFFPFADSIEEIRKAGIRYVVQPGGSVRDEEVIETADVAGMAMVMTGMRHFKH